MQNTHTPIRLSECISALPSKSLALICDRADNVCAISGNICELPIGAQALIHELNAHKHPASSRHTPRRLFAEAAKLLRLTQQCLADDGVRLWHLITDSDAEDCIGQDTVVLSCREEDAHIVCAYSCEVDDLYRTFFLDGTTDVCDGQ